MMSYELENLESLLFRLKVRLDYHVRGHSSRVVQFICYLLFDRMKLYQDLSLFSCCAILLQSWRISLLLALSFFDSFEMLLLYTVVQFLTILFRVDLCWIYLGVFWSHKLQTQRTSFAAALVRAFRLHSCFLSQSGAFIHVTFLPFVDIFSWSSSLLKLLSFWKSLQHSRW